MKETIAIIEFPNIFERGSPECDPFLLERLTTDKELSGILNWALEGLQRLLKNKTFTKYRNLDDVTKYLSENANPVNIFIKTHIVEKYGNKILKDSVWKAYNKFAKLHGHPLMFSNHFSQHLKMYAPWLTDEQPREFNRKFVWLNIELVGFEPDMFGLEKNEKLDIQQEELSEGPICPTEEGVKDVKD